MARGLLPQPYVAKTSNLPAIVSDPVQSARLAGLRYIGVPQDGIVRRRSGRGFSYRDADNRRVTDLDLPSRICAQCGRENLPLAPTCVACTAPLVALPDTKPDRRGPVVSPAGIIGAGLIVVSVAVLVVIGARLVTSPRTEVAAAPTPTPTTAGT